MLCLADNDITWKLAACDLLDDLLASLGISRSEVYVLPSARRKLAKVTRNHPEAVKTRLNDFFGSAKIIDWQPPQEEILLFEDTLGIDHGEAILFSATAGLEDFLVATSDKVSLKALARSPECRAIAGRLAGKVICFEQAIRLCINRFGFDHVKNKVVPARACDGAIKAVFGSGLLATEASVSEGLASYIDEIRGLPIDLLMA